MDESLLNLLSKEEQNLKEFAKYYLVLGVVSNTTSRKEKGEITNAELLYIHEFGSPVKNIPKRPILQWTIDNSQDILERGLLKCVEHILNGKPLQVALDELERTAMRIESFARQSIYKGTAGLEQLKPATIKSKGSDLPLLDTGQLARSIVCLVKRKG